MGWFDWLTRGRSAADRFQQAKSPAQTKQEQKCSVPCEQYKLPDCCVAALREMKVNSLLLAATGVVGGTMQLMGNVDTKTPQTVLVDWSKEGETAATQAATTSGLNLNQLLDNSVKHRDTHQNDKDSPAYQFWSRYVQ